MDKENSSLILFKFWILGNIVFITNNFNISLQYYRTVEVKRIYHFFCFSSNRCLCITKARTYFLFAIKFFNFFLISSHYSITAWIIQILDNGKHFYHTNSNISSKYLKLLRLREFILIFLSLLSNWLSSFSTSNPT